MMTLSWGSMLALLLFAYCFGLWTENRISRKTIEWYREKFAEREELIEIWRSINNGGYVHYDKDPE